MKFKLLCLDIRSVDDSSRVNFMQKNIFAYRFPESLPSIIKEIKMRLLPFVLIRIFKESDSRSQECQMILT